MNIPCPHCGSWIGVIRTTDSYTISARTCRCVLSGEDVRWIVSQARARTPYRVTSWVVKALTALEAEWQAKGKQV